MYRKDPRKIVAKFNSNCAETGKEIKKGETCIYYPKGKKVYHVDSKQADEFRSWNFDCSMLGCDY